MYAGTITLLWDLARALGVAFDLGLALGFIFASTFGWDLVGSIGVKKAANSHGSGLLGSSPSIPAL